MIIVARNKHQRVADEAAVVKRGVGRNGTGTVTGGGGSDTVVVSRDTDFTLRNTQLVASNLSVTLKDISIANLTGGSSVNNLTVQNDSSSADRLTGGSEIDWFFQSSNDVFVDFKAGIGEIKTMI